MHADYFAEKKYVWDYLLGELNGIPITYEKAEDHSGYTLSFAGGKAWFADDFFNRNGEPDELYTRKNLPQNPVRIKNAWSKEGELITLYGQPEISSDSGVFICRADVVASAFFMLTRWEENAEPARDSIGRFPFAASINCRFDLQYRPLVNEYAAFFVNVLKSLGYTPPPSSRPVRFVPSHDIDYLTLWPTWYHRLRTMAGDVLVRRDFTFTKWMWTEFDKLTRNPYHTIGRLLTAAEQRQAKATFYIRSDEEDYSPASPLLLDWINQIHQRGHRLGFHPGIKAARDSSVFGREWKKLQSILPSEPTSGRTHYLNFSVPETWSYWHDACIEEDSSMAYSEEPGFRCSCCTAFPVFDYRQRITVPVREVPLLWMDRHLTKKNLTTETAINLVESLWDMTCKYQGDYVFLWHNSSFHLPEWKPFEPVFDAVYSLKST